MAWSKSEIRRKKYLPFPGHNDKASKLYHSERLPNPNVIRIEVLSPSARGAYLNGGLYAITNRFRQALTESILYGDETRPFYAFFDPKECKGLSFGVTANWNKPGNCGFGAAMESIRKITGAMSKVPVVGRLGNMVGGVAEGAGEFAGRAKKIANQAGLDTSSTGACTLKDFNGAEFNFDKTIVCKWYMPEQENMARLSISRLLSLTFVRSANLDDKDYLGKITRAVSEVTGSQEWNSAIDGLNSTKDDIKTMGAEILDLSKRAATDALGNDLVTKMINGASDYMDMAGTIVDDFSNTRFAKWASGQKDYVEGNVSGMLPSEDTKNLASDIMKEILNGGLNFMLKVNSFFGGNITVSPFPVRITLGHILDIEPAVIKSVKFDASEEQFISEDGTHIPLYISAEISFGMWMTPDPKKGFIRWMGDDVFNSGRFPSSAKSGKQSGTTSSKGGNKKRGGSTRKGR